MRAGAWPCHCRPGRWPSARSRATPRCKRCRVGPAAGDRGLGEAGGAGHAARHRRLGAVARGGARPAVRAAASGAPAPHHLGPHPGDGDRPAAMRARGGAGWRCASTGRRGAAPAPAASRAASTSWRPTCPTQAWYSPRWRWTARRTRSWPAAALLGLLDLRGTVVTGDARLAAVARRGARPPAPARPGDFATARSRDTAQGAWRAGRAPPVACSPATGAPALRVVAGAGPGLPTPARHPPQGRRAPRGGRLWPHLPAAGARRPRPPARARAPPLGHRERPALPPRCHPARGPLPDAPRSRPARPGRPQQPRARPPRPRQTHQRRRRASPLYRPPGPRARAPRLTLTLQPP